MKHLNDGKTGECPECKRVVDIIAREYVRHRTPSGDVCQFPEERARAAADKAQAADVQTWIAMATAVWSQAIKMLSEADEPTGRRLVKRHVAKMLISLAESIGS